VEIIEKLRFEPQAEMRWCLVPLGSIYWSDELPRKMFLEFREAADRDFAMRLFAIRINFWNNGAMKEEDEAFWNEAKTRFPSWPIFQRLELTNESKRAHLKVQAEAEQFFVDLSEEADEFKCTNEGDYSSFSAAFRLEDND
jgi:hypothetical protein